ncbi:PAS domain S-box protein [Methylobacterium durans]|uniref:histidine kinase n=1 Tax=Methylobacterium durans TaxID=2202825 RepID=A0A2U8WD80_9HYPH|nr:PAS domain S-box protein [Methylobacterium durans]AWN44059.1 hybrid sensor histidine kinase/response regulator [Methylobacterium durans]
MDETSKPPSPRATPGQVERDEARISAEIAGTDGGIDPFVAAVHATRMPMVITNPRLNDNPIVFVNDSFCRLTGYDRDEIVGRNCRFLQGTETDRADVMRLRDAIAAPHGIEIDLRNYRKDGTPFWNRLLMAPVHDANGQLAYFFASQLDVTLERDRVAALERENATLTAERLINQDRLAFSEESHQLAVEAAEIGTWDLDLFTDVLTWSDRTKAMFGISPDASVTMADFYACLHPDDRDATAAAFTSALDPMQRATYDVEYRTIGKEDGVLRWVAAKGKGLFDETGRCVRALGTAIDISEQVRARAALAESEERYRTLVENVDVGFCLIEMKFDATERAIDYQIVEANPAFERQTGASLVGQWASDFAPNLERSWFDAYGRVALTGEAAHFENKAEVFDRWFDVRAMRVGDPAAHRVAIFFTDISQRKHMEETLQVLNTTLEQQVSERTAERDRLWDSSEDMLARANYEGMMSAVSPAWTRVLGWSEAELLSRPYATFMHPDDMEPTLAALARMGDTTRPTRFENRIATKDGSWKPIEWTVAPEADGTNFIAVGRDLSTVKAREAELASAQETLRQSQKMEAVGQLTGGLAHDFNNLLAGISGSLELMQTRLQQGRFNDVERYMAAAQGATKRAAALTHRLLAFSRRQTLDPKPTNVNRLVADMQELIQRTVGPAITVEVVGASSVWPALVDPPQLENALLNLCINARDAMPDGGRITIETANKWLDDRAARQHDMPQGQYLSLCVTDTGTGMPPEVIERVFEPFFTTKPLGQGTGLGLSMIYGFVQQSGGQVRIYSEVGKGTTVCLYLPRHYGEAPEESEPLDVVALPRSEQGETVLIVDDEPTVRMLITDILAELGYTAIEAGDSAAGLKVLQSDVRIDLLVTDVGLPGGMNGRQMADAGRIVRPDLKVLFITGYAENAAVGNGHLEPGMMVLTKPFAIETMAARIRSIIVA